MKWFIADAEVAKQQGGMLALYPREDFAQILAVPDGEPPDDLHVTMQYFGQDVTEMPGQSEIAHAVSGIADQFGGGVTAKVFGHAALNPTGEEPCAVYLVGNSSELADLHRQLEEVTAPYVSVDQHRPWLPHITAGYGINPGVLAFSGDIIFDRIALKWAGQSFDFPLA